ncbi:Crp/Fnr family transcriptional regulator [Deinococcus ruber]|uniref:Cyclic nucleotide-binding domain-containing protein n=1 Tax=Deinococcus ruber TaxID=1848197 RepID=A0A918C0P8_9DEIO|nr:Crp/Fnr family transcriptional regulator [Deinococcus ruber]GGQ99742.1 hypothetical protein GCM10008957_10470 [Deinococcus ruber]
MILEGSTELSYQPGDSLMHQDASGQALFLLTEGVVRVSRQSLGGRVRMLGDLYAPAVLGETALLASVYRSASVIALTEAKALAIYRDHLERVVNRYPKVLWNVARLLAERVTQLNDELIAAGISTEASMAQVLVQMYNVRLAAGTTDPQHLPINVSDLSQRLSSSRETTSRLLKKLSGQKLVQVHVPEGTIELLNAPSLEELLHHLASD